jgi:hypothetical protein
VESRFLRKTNESRRKPFGKKKGTCMGKERVMGGEYDQSTLYTWMKIS